MEKFLKYTINVEQQNPSDHYARFVISPLEKGFGNTLGTALRRTMISSMPGSAAFAIKVAGATQEYQTIPGVTEDMTEIVLNVKNLIIKIDESVYTDEELESLTLERWPVIKVSRSGGEVTGADLECPAGISIINKNLHIATVEPKGKLDLQIYATRSRGFRPFTENRDRINTAGTIAVDSLFSPVVRIGYEVEETKTARRGTSDKLIVDVTTNGSLAPGDAMAMAARILVAHLEPIVAINDRISELAILKEREQEERRAALSVPLEEMDLSIRSYNGLKRAGIGAVAELVSITQAELEAIKNLGRKSVREIVAKLAERGLALKA